MGGSNLLAALPHAGFLMGGLAQESEGSLCLVHFQVEASKRNQDKCVVGINFEAFEEISLGFKIIALILRYLAQLEVDRGVFRGELKRAFECLDCFRIES